MHSYSTFMCKRENMSESLDIIIEYTANLQKVNVIKKKKKMKNNKKRSRMTR